MQSVQSYLSTTEDRLLADMSSAARGPRRNGLFALWLIVRQCDSLLPPRMLGKATLAGRSAGLERRLHSLSLPAALRRALPASVRELRAAQPDRVPAVLQQLAAPAREAISGAAADSLLQAARASRRELRARAADGEHG